MRLIPVILLLAAVACDGGSREDAVPRRRAYPRVAVPDSTYARVSGVPLVFEACRAAEARVDSGGRWLTLHYPAYDTDVYVTFSPAASADALQAALDNRRERMSLNLYGAPATTSHVASADGTFEAALVYAPGTGTPLQFVATDGARWVVSGAASMDVEAGAPYDSVRPMVDVLHRDMVHALRTLSADD